MSEGFKLYAEAFSNWVVPAIILFIVTYGYLKKVKVYETFVEGAKEGFTTAVMIIPYLVVIFTAIALFRVSGAWDFVARDVLGRIIPSTVVPGDIISLALIKPLSGSAARGVMLDIFQRHGPDSLTGFMASTIQGSTETTFYVIAVYFGAVGVSKTRYTVGVGLFAEFVAIVISIFLAHLWFTAK